MNNLALVKQEDVNGIVMDFYRNDEEIWVTRKQIGEALEYSDPQNAIYKIHKRHQERLDKYSVMDNLGGTDGKLYQHTLYNLKGILEICRWSEKPKADIVIDKCWDIIDGLYRMFIRNQTEKQLVNEFMSLQSYQKYHKVIHLLRQHGGTKEILLEYINELKQNRKIPSKYIYEDDKNYYLNIRWWNSWCIRKGYKDPYMVFQQGVDDGLPIKESAEVEELEIPIFWKMTGDRSHVCVHVVSKELFKTIKDRDSYIGNSFWNLIHPIDKEE